MKKYIAILEIEDDCEIVGDINASVTYTYKENGTMYATLESVEFKVLEQEPQNAHWEWDIYITKNGIHIPYCKCSKCKMGIGNTPTAYCPYCGTKMEGESHEHIHA